MGKKNQRWNLLAAEVQNQNKEPGIKVMRELMGLSHLIGKYLEANIDVYGLNRTQRRIIAFILSKKDSMTPTELSKISLLTVDTINKSIDNLDKMGLTRSYRSRKDRRVRRVTLTEKGLETVERDLPIRYLVFSHAMSCFTKGELEVFFDYTQRLIDQLSRLTGQDAVSTASNISLPSNPN